MTIGRYQITIVRYQMTIVRYQMTIGRYQNAIGRYQMTIERASPLAGAQAGSNSHWLFALLSEGEGEGLNDS